MIQFSFFVVEENKSLSDGEKKKIKTKFFFYDFQGLASGWCYLLRERRIRWHANLTTKEGTVRENEAKLC